MTELRKPTRKPRMRRAGLSPSSSTRSRESYDEGHAWAVSYADFLMVLLSFFVIFFSVGKQERKDLILHIAKAQGKAGTVKNGSKIEAEGGAKGKGNGNGAGPGGQVAQGSGANGSGSGAESEATNSDGDSSGGNSDVGVNDPTEDEGVPGKFRGVAGEVDGKTEKPPRGHLPSGMSDLAKTLDGFFVEHEDKSQRLYIYFDDNIFRSGEIDLPRAQVERLDHVLKQLAPFIEDVNITFVGHTDNSAVSRIKNKYVSNNFDLSSIRATKALQDAVKLGYSPKKMFAKGVAEHSKGTRTISLVISPDEEDR